MTPTVFWVQPKGSSVFSLAAFSNSVGNVTCSVKTIPDAMALQIREGISAKDRELLASAACGLVCFFPLSAEWRLGRSLVGGGSGGGGEAGFAELGMTEEAAPSPMILGGACASCAVVVCETGCLRTGDGLIKGQFSFKIW